MIIELGVCLDDVFLMLNGCASCWHLSAGCFGCLFLANFDSPLCSSRSRPPSPHSCADSPASISNNKVYTAASIIILTPRECVQYLPAAYGSSLWTLPLIINSISRMPPYRSWSKVGRGGIWLELWQLARSEHLRGIIEGWWGSGWFGFVFVGRGSNKSWFLWVFVPGRGLADCRRRQELDHSLLRSVFP